MACIGSKKSIWWHCKCTLSSIYHLSVLYCLTMKHFLSCNGHRFWYLSLSVAEWTSGCQMWNPDLKSRLTSEMGLSTSVIFNTKELSVLFHFIFFFLCFQNVICFRGFLLAEKKKVFHLFFNLLNANNWTKFSIGVFFLLLLSCGFSKCKKKRDM